MSTHTLKDNFTSCSHMAQISENQITLKMAKYNANWIPTFPKNLSLKEGIRWEGRESPKIGMGIYGKIPWSWGHRTSNSADISSPVEADLPPIWRGWPYLACDGLPWGSCLARHRIFCLMWSVTIGSDPWDSLVLPCFPSSWNSWLDRIVERSFENSNTVVSMWNILQGWDNVLQEAVHALHLCPISLWGFSGPGMKVQSRGVIAITPKE